MLRQLDYASRGAVRPNPNDTWLKAVAVAAIVLTALFIFVVVLAPPLGGHASVRAQIRAQHYDLKILESAMQRYAADCGKYPDPGTGLAALVSAPTSAEGWNGPYLTKLIVNDVWGRPLRYLPNAEGAVRIESSGPDEKWGTADDLTVDLPTPLKKPAEMPASLPADG